MPVKAILFDLDNTLVDFWKFKNKCIDSAVGAMIKAGLEIDRKRANEIIWKIHFKRGMEYKHIFQDFLKTVAGKVDYKLLGHALKAYRKTRENMLIPYPGVISTLKKLKKNYKLAVISDAPKIKAWMRLVAIGAENLFDVVITFEDTRKKKPHPLPFKISIKKLRVHPSEILMVGDSIHKDMNGAKKTGMKTCLALYGRSIIPRKNPPNVDFMIKNIKELESVLRICNRK